MHRVKVSTILLFTTALLALLISGCRQEDGTLCLGVLVPLTGEAAEWGNQAVDGINLAIDDYSSRSSLTIAVDIQDTAGDPTSAASGASYLVQRGCPAIIGGMMSSTTLAAAPICEREQVVLLSPVASSPLLSEAGDYIFRIWPPDTFEARFAANWAAGRGHETASIIYINDDFGVPLRTTIRGELEAHGGRVLDDFAFTAATPNYRPLIRRAIAANPDFIYLIAHYSDAASILRLLRQEGYSGEIIGTNSLNNPAFFREAGSAATTITFPNRIAFDPNSGEADVAAFVERFTAEYGRTPGIVEAQAFDAASLILSSYSSGARNGEEVRTYLSQFTGKSYAGVTGSIQFDSDGDLVSADFRMASFNQNGEIALEAGAN